MTDPAELLWPPPRHLRRLADGGGRAVRLRSGELPPLPGATGADLLATVRRRVALPATPAARAAAAAGPALPLRWRHAAVAGGPEAYHLRVDGTEALLEASTAAGFRHGLDTLAQWRLLHRDGSLPGLDIEDAPALERRGFLLDVSRDRVPRNATLRRLVDLLGDLRFNELQLYTEHSFAYRGHEVVWRGSSPLTVPEVLALGQHAARRGIRLVANQQTFAHMHRWLVHRRYRPLAEMPEGIDHPFSPRPEPFGLCPTDPRSLALIADLFDQLLPLFEADEVNGGLDEPLDLGRGRSAEICRRRGRRAVYLDHLRGVHRLAAERGKRLQFWADFLLEDKDGGRGVPRDALPLVWGYEADHPFSEQLARLADTGRRALACPGTSSWWSFAGRLDVALANIDAACRAARDQGGPGILLTDWGDWGHLQPLPVSWPALVAASGAAWSPDLDRQRLRRWLPVLIDHRVPEARPGDGAALCHLGEAASRTGMRLRNGSVLFHLLIRPQLDLRHERYTALTADGLEEARAWLAATPRAATGTALAAELDWLRELLDLGASLGLARLAASRSAPVETLPHRLRRRLGERLEAVRQEHRPLWNLRSRPGGRRDSLARLTPLAAALQGADLRSPGADV